MPKISVIIPVYNVENYLRKCLDSVINQTLKDIEIICVNDCSPDGCAKILQQYSDKDCRIKIINHQQNSGLSAARNSGIKTAAGEYIYFIDSDDWIDADYLEKMLSAAKNSQSDVVVNTKIIAHEKDKEPYQFYPQVTPININHQYLNASENISKILWSACIHLWKKNFLITNNLNFPEGYIYEDEYFQAISYMYLKKIYVIRDSAYHYTIRNSGICGTSSQNRIKNLTSKLKIYNKIYDTYEKLNFLTNWNFKLMLEIFFSCNLEKGLEECYFKMKQFFQKIEPLIKKTNFLYTPLELSFFNEVLQTEGIINTNYRNKQTVDIIRANFKKNQNLFSTKVSVIIPVYNAEAYLERCLDSVCNQTLKDIEIICVDDCSTDNSLQILQSYAAKYPQLKVIHHQQNGGESKARNTGIDAATGEYLAFVDNDDAVDLDFYEKLYNKAKATNADIAKGDAKVFDYQGKQTSTIDFNSKIKNHNNNRAFFFGAWWTAIYRKSFINSNNIRLPEGFPLGGDMLFANLTSINANKIEIVDNIYYYHYTRENSGDSQTLSTAKIKSALEIFETIANNLNAALTSNKIDTEGYAFAFKQSLIGCCLYDRTAELINKKNCLATIILIYDKCLHKDQIISELKKDKNYLFAEYLQQENYNLLTDYICNYTFKTRLSAKLKAYLKYKKQTESLS